MTIREAVYEHSREIHTEILIFFLFYYLRNAYALTAE